jgi:hypothetical protein
MDNETLLYYAHEGLLKFGGSFGKSLGELLARADHKNRIKIMMMWREDLLEHAELFKVWCAKHRPDLLKDE